MQKITIGTFRSKELNDKYTELMLAGYHNSGCKLCEAESIKEFEHWRIVDNLFPYDLIATTSHMVIPKKHGSENEITEEEWLEFKKIKTTYINESYDCTMENTNKRKSIPAHFHLHLINSKFKYEK